MMWSFNYREPQTRNRKNMALYLSRANAWKKAAQRRVNFSLWTLIPKPSVMR